MLSPAAAPAAPQRRQQHLQHRAGVHPAEPQIAAQRVPQPAGVAEQQRLIETANMHLPGRQLDPARVRRDLWRLSQWERGRMRHAARRPADPSETPLDPAGQ